MNAKQIIADELDEPPRDADLFAEWALASLRAAAGAQNGATITIAPDGTVGRLRLNDFHTSEWVESIGKWRAVPLYRVDLP